MKTKLLSLFLTVIAILTVFVLIACDEDGSDGGGGGEPTACETNGHDWKGADCDTPKTCSVCSATEGSALGHSWTEADCDTPKTCSRCSATEGSALGHDYTVTDKNDSQHWKKCSVCGAINESSRASHTGGEATCTAKAECSVCGKEYGSVDLNNHSASSDWSSNETSHWHECLSCGANLSEATHEYSNSSDTSCDCGYDRGHQHVYGLVGKSDTQHWKKCSCGAIDESSRASHSGGEATCTAKAECSVCGKEYGSLDLNNHDYEESIVKKPTTFEKGEKKFTCSCGDNYTEDIPATKSLKILAIGNSFSIDAMEHLYTVCKDAGIETVVLGNLWKSSCDLQTHLSSMQNNTAVYTFAVSNAATGKMEDMSGKKTALYGITYADWDFITLQQRSALTGISDSYSYLDDVISYVNANKNADAKLLWHMTWAYADNYTSATFAEYNNDQMTMYNAILSCTQNIILSKNDIVGIIPSGTAIQNLRTSHLGDTLNRDGVHLSYDMGRYAAALTYLAAVTGCDISSIDAVPSDYSNIADHLDCIKDAVKKALAKPYEVTESAYPPEESAPALSPLTDADKAFLTANGYDPDRYMLLDLTVTENAYYESTSSPQPYVKPSTHNLYHIYLTTQIFTKAELVNGTLIRIDEGYRYRPVGWESFPQNSTSIKPDNVTETLTVINDSWWGGYNHRAFNISSATSGQKIYLSEAEHFRIYVPVA